MADPEGTFKSPALPALHHHQNEPKSPSSSKKIGLVTEQMEGPVESIDEVETAEVELEKQSKISIQAPSLNYEEPPWACEPDPSKKYHLEILKEGKMIGTYDLSLRKHPTFAVFGRIKPGCDLVMEHPSISRYHCILQYGDDRMSKTGKGWHIYEMGSTHGSKMNKKRLPPKQYIRTRVGFIFQFGESSRIYNLTGPEEDAEAEWDCSPTEMKLRKHKKELEAKLRAAAAQEIAEDEKKEKADEDGCGWGMDYGEDEKTPFAAPETDAHLMEDREAYYNQDPKKALQKFFEREGFDMNFEFSEQGQGHTHKWVCSIELPVEIDGVDRAFTASATVSTSKKDAQIQCALEACRILDTYNVLRKSNTKLRMQRKTLEANDYYDEDDDLYLDRTGQLEKQREKRKQWAEEGYGHRRQKTDTYDSLCAKLEAAKAEIVECQKQLDKLNTKKTKEDATGGDVLDDYLRQLEKTGGTGDDPKTKMEKSKWRQKLVAATHESQKLEKLVKIAKPASVKGMDQLGGSGSKQAFMQKLMGIRARKDDGMKVETSPSIPSTSQKVETQKERIEVVKGPELPVSIKQKEEKQEESQSVEHVDDVGGHSNTVTDTEETSEVKEEKIEKVEEVEKEEFGSKVQKRVAEWEEEFEAEKEELAKKRKIEAEEEAKKKAMRVRRRDIEKKVAGTEDYGAGVEDRDQKYSTWMPPNASESAAKQDALRAKFAGKY